MSGETILIVDDEAAYLRLAGNFLAQQGYRVVSAADAASARKAYDAEHPDLVLLDLVMPPERTPEAGLSALPHFEKSVVIVMTAHSEHELALRAVSLGAWDFLAKPIEPELLKFSVARALAKRALERDLARFRAAQDDADGLIGSGPAMTRLKEMIRRIGAAELPTMILGPTGSGKELVAKALHKASTRRDRPLVSIHCGAIPAELIESELFGHLKGSFTGAHADRAGLVAAANSGTLFLDEVGETPAPMQVKLLRFLQEGTYTPVGARDIRRADVRVICATHRDLDAMITAGGFREDLYYRLRGVIIHTPALEERREDIPQLAAHFLAAAAKKRRLKFSHDALLWLSAQSWPGNVRELRATVECAAALADPVATTIVVEDLAFARGGVVATTATEMSEETLPAATEKLERRMIGAALAATDNNHSAAARRLGLSRVGLLKMMRRFGLR